MLSEIQYIQAFPDVNFRNFVLTDVIGNSRVESDEISDSDKAVMAEKTSLFLSTSSISDLTGLAYFTGLEMLYCAGNALTELDVSNNVALTVLGCEANQLTSLDVSKNTALTALICFDNRLTVLDVSKNTALLTLWCYGNYMNSDADISVPGWKSLFDTPLNGYGSGPPVPFWFFPQNTSPSEPPSAPTLSGTPTADSITLTTIAGAEYRVTTPTIGNWQTSPTFTGLIADTAYTFQARFAATNGNPASDASQPSAVIRTASSFGEIPNTGVPGITGSAIVLLILFVISTALWWYILFRKFGWGYNV